MLKKRKKIIEKKEQLHTLPNLDLCLWKVSNSFEVLCFFIKINLIVDKIFEVWTFLLEI